MAFMEDWTQKGIENWKKNQDVRKKNQKSDEQFRATMDAKEQNRLQKMHESNKKEMIEEISKFENQLSKKGIKPNDMVLEENEEPNQQQQLLMA